MSSSSYLSLFIAVYKHSPHPGIFLSSLHCLPARFLCLISLILRFQFRSVAPPVPPKPLPQVHLFFFLRSLPFYLESMLSHPKMKF